MGGAAVTIIGGGPAGLAAAHEAQRLGAAVRVVERGLQVGGLARTVEFANHRFDVGPHRFYTTNDEVRRFFIDHAGGDVLRVRRLTRIRLGARYFDYPLTPVATALGLGPLECLRILASYAAAGLRRGASQPPATFEDWVVAAFGRRLFEVFFRTYTEKVWGIPCREIGADWAAQRIRGLGLGAALANAFGQRRAIKTLADEFLYPRRGAGSVYEAIAARLRAGGAAVELGCIVEAVDRDGSRVTAITTRDGQGRRETRPVDRLMSSAPLSDLLAMLSPPPPQDVLAACGALRYRSHLAVNLIVAGNPFPDNWIYVHSPDLRAARIANYRNFSPDMAPDEATSPITVEYFCFAGDATWRMTDDALLDLARAELAAMGFSAAGPGGAPAAGFVVRSAGAYPVIDVAHADHIAAIRAWLSQFANLLPIGRTGLFRYNNQDHAIATGLLGARTMLGHGRFDPWQVNIDAAYIEAGQAA
ncbi:MAG: FAD-dependent oxidoreductase [Alphaproteobacteria bacterium]|nr:FAD-dependent oxidoreductase [Alphaproteobacteria bacterium]